MSFPNQTVELVKGRVVVRELFGAWHGAIAAKLGARIWAFVESRGLGIVFGQGTGFKIDSDPDTVRGADVPFVSRLRLPEVPLRGFAAVAPELVVEILSPEDRPGEVLTKIGEWLGAGTLQVWVIDPERAQARVYRADGSLAIVGEDGVLDGADVLPGFSCDLRDILRLQQS